MSKTPPSNKCPVYDTKSSDSEDGGECVAFLHYLYSQVHSDREW